MSQPSGQQGLPPVQPPVQPDVQPDVQPGLRPRPRPPWLDPHYGADGVVWTVVGFIGVLVATVIAFVLAVYVFPDVPWLAVVLPVSLLPPAITGALFGPPRIQAAAYGGLIGFAVQLVMLVVLFMVLAGLNAVRLASLG